MQTVIVAIHLMIVIALVGAVLLQRSEGGGLGVGSPSGFMTGRGTANLLTRTTALLAVGFFVTSLLLSWIAGLSRNEGPSPLTGTSAPVSQPGAPTPVTPSGSGLLDTLKQNDQKQAPSQAPSGPQVPRSQ